MNTRVECVEKNLGDYIKSMTAKAKEEKDALARELEAMDHDDATAEHNATAELEDGPAQRYAKAETTSGSGFGAFGRLDAFEGFEGVGDTQSMTQRTTGGGTLREKPEVVNEKLEAMRHMVRIRSAG